MTRTKMAALVALVVILLTAVSVAAWQLDWFIAAKNTDRQVNIDNRNKGTQTAWHDQVIKTIADYNLIDPNNTAARGALRTEACNLIPRLTDPYRDQPIVVFYQAECK